MTFPRPPPQHAVCALNGRLLRSAPGTPPTPFVRKHKCANGMLLDEFDDNLILSTS